PSPLATVPLSLVAPGVTVVLPEAALLLTVKPELAGTWPPWTVRTGPPAPLTVTASTPLPVATTRLWVSAFGTFRGSRALPVPVSGAAVRTTLMASLALVPLTVTVLLPPRASTTNAPAAAETLLKLNVVFKPAFRRVPAVAPVGV